MARVAVFVGPTLHDCAPKFLDRGRFELFGPIQRGDLGSLGPAFDTVIIVDGYFHATPAVGHIEIRKALVTKRVFGCSSMGAIRAFEMRGMGVIGSGYVYRRFLESDDFCDDEVALLHLPAPSFTPLTEPLVNIRYTLEVMTHSRLISTDAAELAISKLRAYYYGLRTLPLIESVLEASAGRPAAEEFLQLLPSCRVKTTDCIELLKRISNE